MWRSAALVVTALAGTALADDGDDDIGRSETYQLEATHLEVTVTFAHDTGSRHTATRLTLQAPHGKLERAPKDEDLLPLIEKVVVLAEDRWLVLGWTSYGEGMASEVAWIVHATSTSVRIRDELEWTADRSHPGIVLDGQRIGIPVPPRGEELHARLDWRLRFGKTELGLEDLAKRKQTAVTDAAMFVPSLADPRHCTCKVVWLAIDHDRFVIAK